QFGNSENILIMLQPSDVFNLDFLTKLKAFHEALEERLPYVKEVNSLINARQTKGDEGQLLVEELLENFPETEEELIALKRYVISSPLYSNLLVSEDGTLTTVVIKLEAFSSVEEENDSDMIGDDESSLPAEVKQSDLQVLTNEENAEVVKTTRIIIAEFETKDFPIRLTGSPVVTDYLKKSMQGDMKRFIGLAILAIFLFLLVLFRRISGVLLPLLTVILSVVYTFGLLSLTGTAIKVPTVVLPSFLLAIGVGAAVHLMTIFFKYYTEGNKKEAIVEALGHSGLPIAMTGLTTAAGLMSFSTARVEPIAELGFFAACGVLISLCLTLLLLPALLAIVPAKPILS
ncbi:MAG: MMPL family transporter, partial [Proteobacteria bacterium]|nr:MMPL family transporter [Pseudomonadota bacterium]